MIRQIIYSACDIVKNQYCTLDVCVADDIVSIKSGDDDDNGTAWSCKIHGACRICLSILMCCIF